MDELLKQSTNSLYMYLHLIVIDSCMCSKYHFFISILLEFFKLSNQQFNFDKRRQTIFNCSIMKPIKYQGLLIFINHHSLLLWFQLIQVSNQILILFQFHLITHFNINLFWYDVWKLVHFNLRLLRFMLQCLQHLIEFFVKHFQSQYFWVFLFILIHLS